MIESLAESLERSAQETDPHGADFSQRAGAAAVLRHGARFEPPNPELSEHEVDRRRAPSMKIPVPQYAEPSTNPHSAVFDAASAMHT